MNNIVVTTAPPGGDVDGLAGAFADAVDALQASTAAHFSQLEDRIVARATKAGLAAALWATGIVAALATWLCGNAALALWIEAGHGVVVAALIATAIHAVAALLLFSLARARSAAP